MVTTVREDQTRNSRRNAIINGDFNIWQRGTSFVAAVDNTYTADRWVYGKIGAMVHTVSRTADVPTVTQAGRLFNFSLQLALTTADTIIAAGEETDFSQRIEGFNFLPLAQQAMILSFWVKAGIAGTYCVSLANDVPDRSFVAEYTINSANTWEYKTIQIAASDPTGFWNYQNGIGLRVRWALAAGTTFHTATPGVWVNGNFLATANQVNGANAGAGNFRITGGQLERGTTPSLLEYRPFSEELALCQRYYEKSYPLNITPGTALQADNGHTYYKSVGAAIFGGVQFKQNKRSDPIVTIYAPDAGTVNRVEDLNQVLVPFATGLAEADETGIGAFTIPGSTLDPTNNMYQFHWTAEAEL